MNHSPILFIKYSVFKQIGKFIQSSKTRRHRAWRGSQF
nr:MAG TPA: hypothetical protein [Caudoviricetes sp.]